MRRILIAAVSVAGLGIALTACGDEDPTEVGSGLIGPGATTFEVVLEADEFLLADTTYDGLGHFREASFRIAANEFGGEFTAHTLFQITRPFTVSYAPTEGGTSQTDSLAAIRGATLTLVVDSLATTEPLFLEVLPLTESWDPATVTWDVRHDTAGEAEAWTTPGGTTAGVVGQGVWSGGTDTVVIQIDSADAAVWQDAIAAARGALIRAATPDSRVRFRSIQFRFDVSPEENPDTVLQAGSANRTDHIAESGPLPAPEAELRVGGIPVWRSLLHFRDLRDLVLDICAATNDPALPSCDVPIRDASISLASLLLHPRAVQGHRVELPLRIDGRAVLAAPNVPLTRSPLTTPYGFMADSIPTSVFAEASPEDTRVAVPLTTYLRTLVDEGGDDREESIAWLALTAFSEGATYGYAAFSSMESAFPPRLRLVLTIPNEELYQ